LLIGKLIRVFRGLASKEAQGTVLELVVSECFLLFDADLQQSDPPQIAILAGLNFFPK
jgi:hypothetical protein